MTITTVQKLMRIAFWAALLFAYVCAVIPAAPEIGNSDKNTHMIAFFVLSYLARLGWSRKGAFWIAAALVLFGIFIELSQATPIVHRDADVWDVVADTCGVALGLVAGSLALFLFRRLQSRLRPVAS
jgi:VanZ family protein